MPPPKRAPRSAPLRLPRLLPPVLIPTALVLIHHAVEATAAGSSGSSGFGSSFGTFSQWLNQGPGAGALVVGREDLLRVRASLGRISDELHLILGVIDQHIEGTASAATAAAIDDRAAAVRAQQQAEFVPLPRMANGTGGPGGRGGSAQEPRPLSSAGAAWAWATADWLFWLAVFALDIGIVVGMQLFLESIGRKRGGSSIMPKKSVASAMAKAASVPGAPIPTPSGTPGRESTQRLSVLSQEELLAACLTEHWGKLAVGFGLSVAGRLPQHVLNNDGVLCHMLNNTAVMLRCMSLVMLFIRDDVALPKREKVAVPVPPSLPPAPTSPAVRRPSSFAPPQGSAGGGGAGGSHGPVGHADDSG